MSSPLLDDVCPGADDGTSDVDQDGFCALAIDGAPADRDDNDPLSFPGAPEVCDDGLDNNCEGITDDGCPGATTTATIDTRIDDAKPRRRRVRRWRS